MSLPVVDASVAIQWHPDRVGTASDRIGVDGPIGVCYQNAILIGGKRQWRKSRFANCPLALLRD